jgi:ribosome-binding protein aMBF1 (putative translation factor)
MNKLKEIRQKLGMSQQKLADLLGHPQSNISRCESGIFALSLEQACNIKKLCDIKGIELNIEDLIDKKNQPTEMG